MVRVGKEIPLEGLRVGAVGRDQFCLTALGGQEVLFCAETGVLNRLRDIKDVEAFWDGNGAGVDIAFLQASVDLRERGRMVEAVFAGLEGSGFVGTEKVEAVLAADNAAPGKLCSDRSAGRARGDIDKHLC